MQLPVYCWNVKLPQLNPIGSKPYIVTKIYYMADNETLHVLAVIHQKRSSKIWKGRVRG